MATAARQPMDPTRRLLVTVCAMLSTLMVSVDTTIANVALPHIQAGMSASQEQVIWVLTSYLIGSAIATPLSAWLASRYGRKRLMVLSAAGFTLASVACGLATNLPSLVIARVLQGVSGAGLIPLAQAMLFDIYPRESQGKAMAIYGAGVMFGPLIGPTLGGWLTDSFSWRWCFFVNLPLGILSVVGMIVFMRQYAERADTRFDLLGFMFLSGFLAALQLLVDRGQQLDWFRSTEILVEAGLTVAFFYLTVVQVMTAREPFIRPQLTGDRNFVFGCIIGAMVSVVALASTPLVTVMMQSVLGYSALHTGVVSSPRGLGTLISMLVVGRMIGRFDPRLLLVIGLVLNAAGLYLYAQIDLEVTSGALATAGFVQGLGTGMTFVPLSTMVLSTLGAGFRNEGTALYALTRNIGSSLGISFLETVVYRDDASATSRLVEGVRPDNPVLAMAQPGFDFASPQSLARAALAVARQAAMLSYVDIYWLLCLLTLAMIPLAAFMRQGRGGGGHSAVME